MNSMVYISIQPTTTTTATMTTTTVPKSFKTHSPTWTTTTTAQQMHIRGMTYISTTQSMILQPLKLSSIAYNRHIQIHQQPCYYRQPNLTNQVIRHLNHLGYRATRLGEYIYSPWRAQRMGYSP